MSQSKTVKYGLLLGGAGLAAYGATKYYQLNKAIEMLSFSIPKVIVRDKGLEAIRLLMDIEINNPLG